MRRFVISDIHGCNLTFQKLLQKINYSSKDQLYLLGDFIDRGPDSQGVLDFIFKLQKGGHQVFCLKGNHEDTLLDSLSDPELFEHWIQWGGKTTLESFGVLEANQIPERYLSFMENLPLFMEVDEYILVHAGLNFDLPDPFEGLYSMLWIRNWYEDINYHWLKDRIIIHGHTPTDLNDILSYHQSLFEYQVLNLDNGCFVSSMESRGRLCAFELDSQEIFFQENIDNMESWYV